MKTKLIILLFFIILFTGCGKTTLAEQKKQCLQTGNSFYVQEELNFRTGEYVLRGKCS